MEGSTSSTHLGPLPVELQDLADEFVRRVGVRSEKARLELNVQDGLVADLWIHEHVGRSALAERDVGPPSG